MIKKAIAVLPTHNIKATILFYQNNLGFIGIDKGGYVILKNGDAELHFALQQEKNINYNCVACYIAVTDLHCLFSHLAAEGLLNPDNKLFELPGGKKAFTIRDNNGILLRFTQE